MNKIFSVLEVNSYIKHELNKNPILSNLKVKGEISNFKAHTSGHFYFSIKDENSSMRCVMFRNRAQMLDLKLEDGMKIVIEGYISVYEKNGSYQLYANNIKEDGKGNLHIEFEKLKKRLKEEGYFSEETKKDIPRYVSKLGVITSGTGAAVRDIINVAKRRNKGVEIILKPTLVQGEYAADDIVNSIKKMNEYKDIDVIILGRGGGSIEDLWCFNEEKVAKAIYKSDIPIISAVGHETDFTISDFVADKRAATPSEGSELAVFELSKKIDIINNTEKRLKNLINYRLENYRNKLERLTNSYIFKRPLETIYNKQEDLYRKIDKLNQSFEKLITNKKNKYENLAEKLQVLSPLKTVLRGYSISMLNEEIIKDVSQVKEGNIIDIILANGKLKAKVKEVCNEKNKF